MDKSLTILRIQRDIQEIEKSKLVGISACTPNEGNIFEVYANIQIQEGVYRGLLIPIKLILSQIYPLKPPAAYVINGHPFNHRFHEHVFEGRGICTDLTSNFDGFFGKEQGSGWSPAYTVQSVLIQLQTFFSRPDMPKSCMPTSKVITQMMEEAKKFSHTITIQNGVKITKFTHTFKDPFPALKLLDFEGEDGWVEQNGESKAEEKEIQLSDEELAHQRQMKLRFDITNRLVCPITKKLIDGGDKIQFGYPMKILQDKFGRIHVTPVIEIISSDGLTCLKLCNRKDENTFTSIYGAEFNTWVPVYVSKEHFEGVMDHLFETIAKSLGASKFRPEQIVKFFPPLLVKTAIHFLKGSLHESYAAVDAYCQLHYTFRKLVEYFPELQPKIDEEVNTFMKDLKMRSKVECGDLGEFMIKVSMSKWGFTEPRIKFAVFKEFLARQVSWTMKENRDLAKFQEKTHSLLEKFFGAGKVACQFYVLQYETAKLLINPEVMKEQEERYGYMSEDMTRKFRETLLRIKDGINGDWKTVVDYLELNKDAPNADTMTKLVVDAFADANKKYESDIRFAKRNW